jgi:hypothetical protein
MEGDLNQIYHTDTVSYFEKMKTTHVIALAQTPYRPNLGAGAVTD